jgi:hypothetical protein
MTEKGAATMNLMPYYESNCSSQPGIEVKQQAQNYRIAGSMFRTPLKSKRNWRQAFLS